MTLLQAILISLLGYLTYIHVPFLGGGLIGWYCVGRPLVSAFFIGLILGDVTTAIQLGVYIQLIFIGLVTPGGSISPDMNLATYVALPIGVVTGLDAGATTALAITVASIANVMAAPNFAATMIPVNYQKKLVADGKLAAATKVPIWGNGVKFLFRFIPTFVSVYYGQVAIEWIVANSPQALIDVMTIFGNPMSLVGFAILMKLMIKSATDIIYFTVGFALFAALGADMVTVLVFGLALALIEFKVGRARKGA
ncbi:MAG: PTS sugar transporter subunit IIC [Erysipelotrichaceae bacterium]|nr:PTS sugar transporter subunit IIC [Erysipelotrichaceae bacterium]MDD3924080.1 PTS sugar transporter subunit IIC [Erysipelotrichaceae bacterium]MDD4643127.1 PTS sugar transporter subunit IIC [Erysipelotrichaceae bacterium]